MKHERRELKKKEVKNITTLWSEVRELDRALDKKEFKPEAQGQVQLGRTRGRGRAHKIRLRYTERDHGDRLSLLWESFWDSSEDDH